MYKNEILNEREKTHGDFGIQAQTAQRIKQAMVETPNWQSMPPYMKESLDLIATKISRMCHGDWKHVDSSKDIAGYAELVVAQLEK